MWKNRLRKEQRRGNGRVRLDGWGGEVGVLRSELLSQSQVWGSRRRIRFVAAVCLNLNSGFDAWRRPLGHGDNVVFNIPLGAKESTSQIQSQELVVHLITLLRLLDFDIWLLAQSQ